MQPRRPTLRALLATAVALAAGALAGAPAGAQSPCGASSRPFPASCTIGAYNATFAGASIAFNGTSMTLAKGAVLLTPGGSGTSAVTVSDDSGNAALTAPASGGSLPSFLFLVFPESTTVALLSGSLPGLWPRCQLTYVDNTPTSAVSNFDPSVLQYLRLGSVPPGKGTCTPPCVAGANTAPTSAVPAAGLSACITASGAIATFGPGSAGTAWADTIALSSGWVYIAAPAAGNSQPGNGNGPGEAEAAWFTPTSTSTNVKTTYATAGGGTIDSTRVGLPRPEHPATGPNTVYTTTVTPFTGGGPNLLVVANQDSTSVALVWPVIGDKNNLQASTIHVSINSNGTPLNPIEILPQGCQVTFSGASGVTKTPFNRTPGPQSANSAVNGALASLGIARPTPGSSCN
jgi:hypothetical protein